MSHAEVRDEKKMIEADRSEQSLNKTLSYSILPEKTSVPSEISEKARLSKRNEDIPPSIHETELPT